MEINSVMYKVEVFYQSINLSLPDRHHNFDSATRSIYIKLYSLKIHLGYKILRNKNWKEIDGPIP
jgi:hypothetical protein